MIINKKQVKSIINKSNLPIAGYTINPYIGCPHKCKYCYAEFMKRFTNHKEEWGTFLDVKYWDKIKKPEKYTGKTMIIGSVTDGYNPYEEKYQRTKEFLEQMKNSQINLIITTKSDLVLRDINLIKQYPNPLVSWSINTLNNKFQQDMDEATPIKNRIKAMKKFHKEKIKTTCFISPIFPEITDPIEIIEKINKYTDYIWLENLNLRGSYKKTILEYIKNNHPELTETYNQIYNKKNTEYWEQLDDEIKTYAENNKYIYVIDKEPFLKNPTNKPILINYFYHNKITQSAKKRKK